MSVGLKNILSTSSNDNMVVYLKNLPAHISKFSPIKFLDLLFRHPIGNHSGWLAFCHVDVFWCHFLLVMYRTGHLTSPKTANLV